MLDYSELSRPCGQRGSGAGHSCHGMLSTWLIRTAVFTAHTLSPVPLVVIDAQAMGAKAADAQDPQIQADQMEDSVEPLQRRLDLERQQPGRLADIAPTLLDLMELPIPPEFTGRSLLIRS